MSSGTFSMRIVMQRRAIRLICNKLADACMEGSAKQKEDMQEEVTEFSQYQYDDPGDSLHDASDEDLLGASTLAKIAQSENE